MLDRNKIIDEIEYYEERKFTPKIYGEWIFEKIKSGFYDKKSSSNIVLKAIEDLNNRVKELETQVCNLNEKVLDNEVKSKIDNKEITLCTSCPECGHQEFKKGIWRPGNEERICVICGQSWFSDIDYGIKKNKKEITDTERLDFFDRNSLEVGIEHTSDQDLFNVWDGDVIDSYGKTIREAIDAAMREKTNET